MDVENSSLIQEPERSLRKHIREERFHTSKALQRVRKEFEDCQSPYSRISRFVVVHSPYPEQRASSQPELDDSPPAARWGGSNCGTSDLLLVVEEGLAQNGNCRLVSFLDHRNRLADGESFYEKVFLEELINQQPGLTGAGRIWLARLFDTVFSVVNRLALFVKAAALTFASVLTATITANSARFLLDVWQKPEYAKVVLWLERRGTTIGLASAGLLLIWVLYAWAKVRFDRDSSDAWANAWRVRTPDEIRAVVKEDLRKKQTEILRRLAGKRQTLAILIDDLDALDGGSFGSIAGLYEAAQKSRSSLFILAAYNPANPKLRLPEHAHVAQELEPENARQNGWELVELAPPTRAQVMALLWSYFKDERIAEQVRLLEQNFTEVADDPGLLLTFLAGLENDSNPPASILSWGERELLARFDEFLTHDLRIAEELIESIKRRPEGENCKEVLKYLLGFHQDRIPDSHFRALIRHLREVDSSLTAQRIAQCVKVLEDAGLIQTMVGVGPGRHEFTPPHLRAVLETGWREWRRGSEKYSTRVFDALHRVPNLPDSPVLALAAEPKPGTIDVLWREGEYHLNYLGCSDAGYALRYYGLRRGGALGKWLAFCAQPEAEEVTWSCFYWKSDARNNPYRNINRKQYPAYSFAPDLVLTAGRLYWMTGDSETAAKVWDDSWRKVCDRLRQPPAPAESRKLQAGDARIRTALADMLYWRGGEGDWEQAGLLCQGALRGFEGPVRAPGARLLLALMEHYRTAAVGNNVAGIVFLPADADLSILRQAAADLPDAGLERVRALHLLAECLFESSEVSGAAAPEMDLDRCGAWEAPARTGEIESSLDDMLGTLEKFAASRRGARFPANDTYRTEEGDLLYWQALYTLHRARHFRIEAIRLVAEDRSLLSNQRASQPLEVLKCCAGIGRRLGDYCMRALLEHQPPGALAGAIGRLESAAERGEREPGAAPGQALKSRHDLEQLYKTGWSVLVSAARERFRLADAVHRRLGCRPGIAAVALEMGRLDRTLDLEAPSERTRRPQWIESYERFFHYAGDALGYHLDALRARLDLAAWGSEQDVPRAIAELRLAEQWAAGRSLGLPAILLAELRYRRAGLMGNLFEDRLEAEALELFEKALQQFDRSAGNQRFLSDDDLLYRQMDCRWWLAELLLRKSTTVRDSLERSNIRRRALGHCDSLRMLARDSADWINKARLIQGILLPLEQRALEGLTELEKALAHFESRDDSNYFFQVQILTHLVHLTRRRFDEEGWEERARQGRKMHPGKLVNAAERMLKLGDQLDFYCRLVLARACRVIGTELTPEGADPTEFSLAWLNEAFTLYEGLRLFGHAVELFRPMEALYRKAGDEGGLASLHLRVAAVIRQFDPTRDQMPPGFSAVMLECVGLALPLSGEDGGKREALERARSMMRGSPPDYAGAIESLEFVRRLLDADNPQETDAQALALLRDCYYLEGDGDKAGELEHEFAVFESTRQSRDFLALASHYEKTGADSEWALQMAAEAAVENRYSREARELLRGMRFEQAARQASGAA